MIDLKDIISLLGILIVNGIAIATAFTKLNIKIAENSKDILAIRADIEEHKVNNKVDLKEFKEVVLRDRLENKEDHQRVIDSISKLADLVSDLRVEIFKSIKSKK